MESLIRYIKVVRLFPSLHNNNLCPLNNSVEVFLLCYCNITILTVEALPASLVTHARQGRHIGFELTSYGRFLLFLRNFPFSS
jgi:hypothetical protein